MTELDDNIYWRVMSKDIPNVPSTAPLSNWVDRAACEMGRRLAKQLDQAIDTIREAN